MSPEDFQSIEILVLGWIFGVMTAILYASVANYIEVKRRNKR